MTAAVTEQTKAWCVQRGHPWVTYNLALDRTWCRCGERQQTGEAPADWKAKWELFHDHGRDEPCRCYAGGGAS
jgi:hypothetical protein